MPRFYVSGIIQIEVYAADATDAGKAAQDRAVNLMRRYPSLNIGMEEETAEPAPSTNVTPQQSGTCERCSGGYCPAHGQAGIDAARAKRG